MRWTRWVVLALAIAAGCCLAVAAVQWYVRTHGMDDLVCRSRQPPTGPLRDCLDTRPDPFPAALTGIVLAASALMVWLRATATGERLLPARVAERNLRLAR